MKYKLLGNTGLRVSELCLGTMTFGTEWGWGAGKRESKKIFDAFAEAGGNFIDTANYYTFGTSEKFVGDFIKADRDHWVVATKYSLWDKEGDPNYSGNHRKNMIRSVEESLKRMKTDYIDLFYLHIWDHTTPVEEIMRAMDDLVRSGKILYAGISDTPAWIVSKADTLARLRGTTTFCAYQFEYSLVQRTVEADLVPASVSMEMAMLAWAPLGSGVLTAKYLDPKQAKSARLDFDSSKLSARNVRIAKKVKNVADRTGMSPAQVAINWLRQKHRSLIPILGARKYSQIKDNLGCLDHEIPPRMMASLDKVSAVEHGFPHNFLEKDAIKSVVSGNTYNLVERRKRF